MTIENNKSVEGFTALSLVDGTAAAATAMATAKQMTVAALMSTTTLKNPSGVDKSVFRWKTKTRKTGI